MLSSMSPHCPWGLWIPVTEKEIIGGVCVVGRGEQGPNIQNKASLANQNVFCFWVEISSRFGNTGYLLFGSSHGQPDMSLIILNEKTNELICYAKSLKTGSVGKN